MYSLRVMSQGKTINRRTFIYQSSIVATGAMIGLSACSSEKANKYKMGLQLFTIRDAMATDAKGSLIKAAAMGYQDLETYGFDPEKRAFYGYSASDFKSVLEDLELTTSSGHYDLANYYLQSDDALKRYVDQCIEGAHAIGQSYITWPWMPPEMRNIETFRKLTDTLNTIGEQVTKGGLGFAYHNHDFEFTDHNGEIGYDLILQNTDPELVKLQMDMYWVMHSSKHNPNELIELQPGRFVMWHIKDMDKVTRDYSELGNGSIDYNEILPGAAELAGLEYYFLEQGGNFASSSMESIKQSAEFFKKNLKQYL